MQPCVLCGVKRPFVGSVPWRHKERELLRLFVGRSWFISSCKDTQGFTASGSEENKKVLKFFVFSGRHTSTKTSLKCPLGGLQPRTEEGRDSIVQGLLFESSKTKEYFPIVRPSNSFGHKNWKANSFPPKSWMSRAKAKTHHFPILSWLDSGEIGLNSSSVFGAQDWSSLFVKPETSRCFDQTCKFSVVRTIESENIFQFTFKWKT